MKINKIKEKLEEVNGEPEPEPTTSEDTEGSSATEDPEISEELQTTTLPTETPTEYLEVPGDETDKGQEPEQPEMLGDEEKEEGQSLEKEDEEDPSDEESDEEEPRETPHSNRKFSIKSILKQLADKRKRTQEKARRFFRRWRKNKG